MSDVTKEIESYGNYSINLHGVRLPSFTIPDKYLEKFNLKRENCSNYDFLRGLCLDGFKKLNLVKGSKEYNEYSARTKRELETFLELGFVDYILLVWLVINYCHENKIPVGFGRGSAAGSLVLSLIGVTKIDPIKYDLFFERFVSKTRAKKKIVDEVTYLDGSLMCDVDMDICYYRRHEVLKFLDETFKGKTSKILTLNTLSGKLLIKECGKTISDKSETEMISVAELVPKIFGKVKDINEAYDSVPEFKSWCNENQKVYKTALKLRDLIKNKGVHASGIILSYSDIQDNCPIELDKDKNLVSGYDMEWVSLINVKLDCLGLRSVSVVEDICQNVGISPEDIDVTSPEIYQNLQELKCPHGLFQIEADTAYKAVRKIKPKNLEELSGVLAIARPGAMQFLDEYATFTNTGTAKSVHPFFDDIFGVTGGQCLYQEQLISAIRKIGFSAEEGEIFRRIVGKKKDKEMKEWKSKIENKIKENNLDPDLVNCIWSISEASANYSFNKSHSISYATLSAQTIYLKFKYPLQFFLSLLKMSKHEPKPREEISKIAQELHHFGIKLLKPDLVKSEMDFSIQGNNIRFGLTGIKGISDETFIKLENFIQKKHSNELNLNSQNKFSIFQAVDEAGLSISNFCALIQAGAFEEFNFDRSYLVLEAQLWHILSDKEKKYCLNYAERFNYSLVPILKFLLSETNDKGKTLLTEKRYETIKNKYTPFLEIFEINSRNQDFANWYYEEKLIGHSCDVKLTDVFRDKYKFLKNISQIQDTTIDSSVRCVAKVISRNLSTSKKGTKYLKMIVSDETGIINVLCFNSTVEEVKSLNNDKLPDEDNIVYVAGTKKADAIFANIIYTEDNKIYTKLGDFNKDKKKEENLEDSGDLT